MEGKDNQDYAETKVQYSRITYNKRLRLIDMVETKKYSIYKASKQLGISNSTAKLIIKNYREEGHIFQKKSAKFNARKRSEQVSIPSEKPTIQIKKQEEEEPLRVKSEGQGRQFQNILKEVVELNTKWLCLYLQKHLLPVIQ